MTGTTDAGAEPDAPSVAALARRWWPEILVIVLSMAAVVPVFHRYVALPPEVTHSSDYLTHLRISRTTGSAPFHLPTPHPMFHVSVYVLAGLLGQTWAAVVVLTAATGLLAGVLLWFARAPMGGRGGLGRWWAIGFALGYLVLESPAIVAQALQFGTPLDWSPSVHMYLSPTDSILAPFGLAQAMLLGAIVARGDAPRRFDGPVLLAASVLSVLAKPSMAMVLLVAVPLALLTTRRMTRPLVRFLAIWFVLPTVLIGVWQTRFIETGGNHLPPGGIVVHPLEMIRLLHLDQATPLLYSALLIVVLCWWAGGRRYFLDPTVAIALWSFVTGVAIMALLNETGARQNDGTFTKPAFIAGVLLTVVSWSFLGEVAAWWAEPSRRWRGWVLAGAIFATVSIAAGILAHLDASGVIHLANHARRGV